MKILFVGGYGNISWHCTQKALELGNEVYLLNRSQTTNSRRELPIGAKLVLSDVRDIEQTQKALDGLDFDVVCDFICYHAEEAKDAIKLFKNKTKQYIVVSSGANYNRIGAKYPLTEDVPQFNNWTYAKNKIEMEQIFMSEYKASGFPVTIVRPGQTYDTLIPDAVGNADWTVAQRIIDGKPIIIFGDGTTLWTVTHSKDFANAFVQLFANPKTIGEAYHITSDEWLTWNEITSLTAKALGVDSPKIIYMPTNFIAKINPDLAIGIAGHKMHCDIYDNSKIKSIAKGWEAKIKFKDGIKQSIEWLKEDRNRRRINQKLNADLEELLISYGSIGNVLKG